MINILPYKQRSIIARVRSLRAISMTIWAALLLSAAAALLLLPLFVTIDTRYGLVTERVAAFEQSGSVASPVDVAALAQRTRALTARLAAPTPVSPIEYIGIVQSLAPSTVTLSGFAIDQQQTAPTLSVTGIARTREALQQFVERLGSSEKVAAVDSPVSNYVRSASSQFAITVVFK